MGADQKRRRTIPSNRRLYPRTAAVPSRVLPPMDSLALAPAARPVVALVDDEPQVRTYLGRALGSLHAEVLELGSVAEFWNAAEARDMDCAVVDLRLPDGCGLELAGEVRARGLATSLILATGFASVRIAVQAVQRGMIDVLEKPILPADVMAAVLRGLALCDQRRAEARRSKLARESLTSLTASERDVLELVLAGLPNKTIARSLGLGLRTVESRKAQLYSKLQVGSMAELIQAALAGGFVPERDRSAAAPRPVALAAG